MRVLIVEPKADGHHMVSYVRFIVRAAVGRGWSVQLLTTENAVGHKAFEIVRGELPPDSRIHVMDDVEKPSSSASVALMHTQNSFYNALARGFARLPERRDFDFVYVVNLDHFDKVLSLRGSPFGQLSFGGMMMSVKFHRHAMGLGPESRNDFFYGWLFRRMLAIPNLEFCTVVDEPFMEYAAGQNREEYRKLVHVPDVGELCGNMSRDGARRKLGIGEDRFVVLVFGALTRRKGIRELLQAVEELSQDQGIVQVHLAGRQNESIKALMKTPLATGLKRRNRLIVSEGFQDEEQEYRAFRSADAVWVGYVMGFTGSSGVLIQAASIGLPAIASDKGLVGWLTKKHGLGVTVTPGETLSVKRAIAELACNDALRTDCAENGRRFARRHAAVGFGEVVCDAIAAGAKGENV